MVFHRFKDNFLLEFKMKTILQQLENYKNRFPDKIAFADEKNSFTYKTFVENSKKIACEILNKIQGKNQPIAVFDNRDVYTLTAMFGALFSGNYYVVLDSHSPADRLQKIVSTLNPSIFLCSQENTDLVSVLNIPESLTIYINTVNCETDEKLLSLVYSKIISTDPAYALFTSGSTGMPKGTVLSHGNILAYIEWFTKQFDVTEDTIFANQTPFYFSMSVSDIFGTVYTCATFNIVPKSYFSFPIQLINYLNEREINTIYWVPSALCIVANLKLFDYTKPKYLKKVMFAGEVMPIKQLNYWIEKLDGVTFANLFGPTETTDICTFYVVNRTFKDEETLPIGKHCDNCDTFIVGDDGKEITEIGKIGELYARGPFVAYGYYDNAEKTNSSFVQNPLQSHYPEKVYRTGDLVKLNKFGEYEYMGRKDFQIKHMGYRIELGEIEANAGAIEKVNGVVCVYDTEKDNIVCVYEGRIKENDFLTALCAKIPDYMVPNVIIRIKQLPYNANGKIDRLFIKNNYKNLSV